MTNMVKVSKKEFLEKFKTGFQLLRNDHGVYDYDHRRTSIREAFFSKPFNGTDSFDEFGEDQNVENLSVQEAIKKADEYYRNRLIVKVQDLEAMIQRFSKIKKVLYRFGIGKKEKIEYANKNYQNLQTSKNMIAGITKLPAKRVFLLPDELLVPEFIPEIGQSFFSTDCSRNNSYKITEYKVVRISLSADYDINNYENRLDLYKDELKTLSKNEVYVTVELQEIGGTHTITLRTEELFGLKDGFHQQNTFNALATTREKAVELVENYATDLIKSIEMSVKSIK